MVIDVGELLGEGWASIRFLPGGGAGATLVRRPHGSLAVLRVATGSSLRSQKQRTANIKLLRTAGYLTPAEEPPRELADGRIALVTDFVADAEPVLQLTHRLLDDMLDLNDRQAGLAPAAGNFGAWLHRSLTDGFTDWCRPAALYSDPRCAALAKRAARQARLVAALPPSEDLIHGDLHQGNLLARDGRLTAVIDCLEVRPGDRNFDLVTALTIDPQGPGDVLQRLRDTVESRVAPPTLAVYIAHLGVRILDWALTHSPATVDHWLSTVVREFDRYGV